MSIKPSANLYRWPRDETSPDQNNPLPPTKRLLLFGWAIPSQSGQCTLREKVSTHQQKKQRRRGGWHTRGVDRNTDKVCGASSCAFQPPKEYGTRRGKTPRVVCGVPATFATAKYGEADRYTKLRPQFRPQKKSKERHQILSGIRSTSTTNPLARKSL